MDAFISWTSADRDVKNALAAKLQAAGISFWDSDEECTSDFSEECIAAIDECKVFIVIVSDASMAKGYVKNEVIRARELEDEGRLNIVVYKITDSPYTKGFPFRLNHITYVTGNLILREPSISGDSSIDRVVRSTQRLLAARKSGQPEKPYDVYRPKPGGLKITGAGYFVEHSRDAVLDAMSEAFKTSNVIILREFFGFGKRSAIRKFVELHPREYKHAFLLTNTCGSLRDFLLSGLEFTNIDSQRFQDLEGDALIMDKLQVLSKLESDTLLAITDVSFDGQPDQTLCQQLRSLDCRIILLTQESAGLYADWFPVIRVGRMDDPYLSELFFHHYNCVYDEEKELLEEPLHRYFANIGGHTKTVELTATVLNRELSAMPEQLPNYLSMQGSEGMQLQDRVMQQLTNIFNMAQLSEAEYVAMLVAACLAVPYISVQHYRSVLELCCVRDWNTVLELDRRRWLDLDSQNRTVSIEPLLAQIVISRSAGYESVLTHCLVHLHNQFDRTNLLTVFLVTMADNLSRFEHFFRLTGFTDLKDLCTLVRRSSIDDNYCDTQAISDAIDQFHRQYPMEEFSDGPEEGSFGTKEYLVYTAQLFIRSGLLSLARMQLLGSASLFSNFSDGSNRILAQQQNMAAVFDTKEMLGISTEELLEMLTELRDQFSRSEELDAQDVRLMLLAETINLLTSVQKRDILSMQLSTQNIWMLASQQPELLQDADNADWFCLAMMLMAQSYFQSGAYVAAIRLCEQTLSLDVDSMPRLRLLQIYCTSKSHSGQYDQPLFDTYQSLLSLFDRQAAGLFDKRSDMYPDKKLWLLNYAQDLAAGELPEQAQAQFAAAQKLNPALLPKKTVDTAESIVNVLIRMGQFRQVPVFLERHFSDRQIAQLASQVDADTQQVLETFVHLRHTEDLDSDFINDSTPPEQMDYYQRHSRKNNGLWERKYFSVADQASDFDFSELTDQQITEAAEKLRQRAKREPMRRLMPEAFALASEAGFRVLGYRHHYVQYMGGAAMADGKIAEIYNGEGKTYTIVLPAFLCHLYGQKVYVIDQSEYLSERNRKWMQGVYGLLGMSSQYVPDNPPADTQWTDVSYLTVHTFTVHILRNEVNLHYDQPFHPDCIIIDEADTVLVDSAQHSVRLAVYESARDVPAWHDVAWQLMPQVAYDARYCRCDGHRVTLLPDIFPLLERHYCIDWSDFEKLKQIQQIEEIIRTAISCYSILEKDRDYFIHKGQPKSEDAATGLFREMDDSTRYFLCLLNGLDTTAVRKKLSTHYRITNVTCMRDFFRRFRHLCGTTATAASFREDFRDIYGLEYVSIPSHLPCIRENVTSPLYTNMRAKDQAILQTVRQKYEAGQPLLLITQSTPESEKYHRLLNRAGIPHQLLNARNTADSAGLISRAGIPGSVLVANAFISRGADVKLGGDPEMMTRLELAEMGEDLSQLDAFLYRLPTPELKQSPLYQKYYSILEKNRHLTAADRKAAEEAGGLCVIGTSFFPELRSEQQTRGRSGRQGAPGQSIVFRSLEDATLVDLVPSYYMDILHARFPDLDNVDNRQIRKLLETCQAKIHRNSFAKIRSTSSETQYIEAVRSDFMDIRFSLMDGSMLVDDFLEQWLTHNRFQQGLQALQRGESTSGSKAVDILYRQYPQLHNLRGPRGARLLLECFRDHLAKRTPGADYNASKNLCRKLAQKVLDAWVEYIAVVQDTSVQTDMKQKALEAFLTQEKERLLLFGVLDWLFFCKLSVSLH